MAPVLGVWSTVLKPGEPAIVSSPAAIRVLNVTLGEEVADEGGRSVVKLTYEDLAAQDESEEDDGESEGAPQTVTPICTLIAGKTETVTVDLVLEEESLYKFEVSGKNTVYLSGNYFDQGYDQDPSDSELDYDSDEDGGYRLEDVSSDVEMDINELDEVETDASRFEEIEDKPASSKGQKRPRESEDGKSADDAKANKKNKKQKGETEAAVAKEQKKEDKKEDKKKDKKADAADAKEANTFTTPGGVVVKDVKIGKGPEAKKGQTVSMRYKGRLKNGQIFDQNLKGKPFVFHLGKGEVIKGWDEGIVGMRVDGERLLTIPSNMGYGKRGTDGIPPNSTLIFEVKLLQIK